MTRPGDHHPTRGDSTLSYLEEAADLLRKAADENEKRHAETFCNGLIEGQERIAMKFAQLAAIENGLLPPEMLGELLVQARAETSR